MIYPHHLDGMTVAVTTALADLGRKRGSKTPFRQAIRAALAAYWTDQMAIVWTTADVLSRRPALTREDARQVLCWLAETHNAELGVSWHTIDAAAARLFPDQSGDLEALQQHVKDYYERLAAAGDRASIRSVFGINPDTETPNFAAMDEEELKEIYQEFALEE